VAKLIVKKGDKGYLIEFSIQENDGTPSDLTNYTVTLKAWTPGTSGTTHISGACSVTNAAGGVCTYTLLAADTTAVAHWEGELELTKTGVTENTLTFAFVVEDSG